MGIQEPLSFWDIRISLIKQGMKTRESSPLSVKDHSEPARGEITTNPFVRARVLLPLFFS